MTTDLPSSSPGELSSPPEQLDSPGGGGGGGGGGGSGGGAEANVLALSNANSVSYPDLSAKATNVTNGRGVLSTTSASAGRTAGGEEITVRKKRARTANAEGREDDSSKPAKVARKTRAPRKPKVETVPTPAASQPILNGSSSIVSTGPSPGSRQNLHNPVDANSAKPEDHSAASQSISNGTAVIIPRQQTLQVEHTNFPTMSEHSVPSPRSGQRYDPIRSSTMDSGRPYSPSSASQASPTKMPNRASASPSISSLIDPPTTSGATFVHSPPNRPSPSLPNAIPYHSPSTTYATPVQSTNVSLLSTRAVSASPVTVPVMVSSKRLDPSDAMDVDSEKVGSAGKQMSRKTSAANSNPPSKAASPKPMKKEKAATPPLPPLPGTGAVASLFGAVPDKSGSAPTIVLNIPLNGETNKYINFAQLAEKEYGFSGLHPRLTSQRDRLARVAAAGAALENAAKGSTASGDDMSVDESDNENDMSTAEVGDTATGPGSVVGDGKDSGDAPKPRKKRRFKEDMYDKDDPFVDDSELAWEEQAAASKDGFFVYSGPLVPEGETARVERADGTIIKPPGTGRGRGRGRGGGPGSRGGGGAAAATTAARGSATATTAATSSRGGQVTKKPRMRRGERAALNAAKKEERERLKAEKLAAKAEKQAAREAKREAREAKLEAAAASASVDATPRSIRTDGGDAISRPDATPSKSAAAAPALPQPPPLAMSSLTNGTSASHAPGPPLLAPAPAPALSTGGAPNGMPGA